MDVNKQLLDAAKELASIVEIHSEATDSNFAWAELSSMRDAIAAAEQAQQAEPVGVLVDVLVKFVDIMDGCGNWPDTSTSQVKLGDLAKEAVAAIGRCRAVQSKPAQPPAVAVPDADWLARFAKEVQQATEASLVVIDTEGGGPDCAVADVIAKYAAQTVAAQKGGA